MSNNGHFRDRTKYAELCAGIACNTPARSFVRSVSPRKHLRVLPSRTRPSLFAGD